MDRRDQKLLDKQMRRLSPRHEKRWCNSSVACRIVLSWDGCRRRPVYAPKPAGTNRIDRVEGCAVRAKQEREPKLNVKSEGRQRTCAIIGSAPAAPTERPTWCN